jgi:hypothetical protein
VAGEGVKPVCDDQSAGHQQDNGLGEFSRRGFLAATGAAAAATAVLRRFPRLPLRSPARAVTADGTSAYSMAMHIHSSFSEQSGSMDAQLFQAATNAVDVLWWTDHDYLMDHFNFRKTVHFTSLTAESGGPGEGKPWTWVKQASGPLAGTSTGGIVTSPSSPNDPVAGGSMHLAAKSTSAATARYGYYADCHPAGWNYRGNLTGQSLTIDVRLTSGWRQGYLEMLVATSFHEAAAGRPAGLYSLSYRFVPAGSAGRAANGLTGVITIPVTPGSWKTVTVTPASDIAALWPDLDYRDFALFGLTLSAASTGDLAEGYFDYLRFTRKISGEAFLEQQQAMEPLLAGKYPKVAQRQGLEVSRFLPHINWFGGGVADPDYGSTTWQTYTSFLAHTVIPRIHTAGGLASYNHPYGYSQVPLLPTSQQDALLKQTAARLLPSGGNPAALGADLLEVGYRTRQGCDLAHHVGLWDVLSRNAVFLTGNGTSDDHIGQNWRGIANNWITSVWAASTAEADLLHGLAAGRAWCGSLSAYRGTLDLLADGSVPMGAVSVSSVTSRKLAITATGLPSGGSLQVVQGTVDYAGTANPVPNATVIGSYTAAQLAGGGVTRVVDTTSSRFFRVQVLDSGGKVIAISNPVWLLRSAPPGGIPPARRG